MKSFRTIVWSNFFAAVIAVNVISEVGYYYTGIYIPVLLRLAFITGVTVGMTILIGSMALVMKMSEEIPHSTYARDTLAFDRNRKHNTEQLNKLDQLEQSEQQSPEKSP
ncbi:MAG: hypothetical protein RL120_01655 [Gammaproteobacteria bacterium]